MNYEDPIGAGNLYLHLGYGLSIFILVVAVGLVLYQQRRLKLLLAVLRSEKK